MKSLEETTRDQINDLLIKIYQLRMIKIADNVFINIGQTPFRLDDLIDTLENSLILNRAIRKQHNMEYL